VVDPIIGHKIPPEKIEPAALDRLPGLSHEIQIKVEIVQAQQAQAENFLSFD
jgi:hypothetical protein